MPFLLDTHTILWALSDEQKLSLKVRTYITDIKSECYVGFVSLFEMAIKKKIGKLVLDAPISMYASEIERIGIKLIGIEQSHLDCYNEIPLLADHRDPFDRLLLATAFKENFVILTSDEKLKNYKDLVTVLW